MQPKHLSILGVGLLGGSIGLAAKSFIKQCVIIGYGHRPDTLKAALTSGAIDEAANSPAAAVKGADLVILCTPLSIFEELLQQIAPALSEGTIVTDVGSTKRSVVDLAGRILPPNVHFVGSHPIAGSEKRGIEFARADLFRHALCITTPTKQTNREALSTVESFWTILGMRLTRLAPDAHDKALSDISHLPHALAAALVAMQEPETLNLCGKGFLDTTRIAGGDGALWRDILIDNRDNLRDSIHRLRGQLDHLLALLEPDQGEALKNWLNSAAARRDELLHKKLREMNPD